VRDSFRMRFPFNERKAAQAAAYILAKRGGEFDYGCLVKLLYFADRRALVENQMPITGGWMIAMEHGPVLSEVLDCLNGKSDEGVWPEYISTRDDGNRVVLVTAHPDSNGLSEFEMDILQAVVGEHGDKNFSDLGKYAHDNFPEVPQVPRGKMRPILVERILHSEGMSNEEIAEVHANALSLTTAVEAGGSGL